MVPASNKDKTRYTNQHSNSADLDLRRSTLVMSRHRSRRLIPTRRGRVSRHGIRISRAGHHHRRGTRSGISLAAVRNGRRRGQSHGDRGDNRGRVVAGRARLVCTAGAHRLSGDGSRDDGLSDGHGVGAWRLDGRGLVGAVRNDACGWTVGRELGDWLCSVCSGGDGLRDRHGVGARCLNRSRLIGAICDDSSRRAVSCNLGDALGSVRGGRRSLRDRHGIGARRLNRRGLVGTIGDDARGRAIGSDLSDVLCSVLRGGIRPGLVDWNGA